MSLEVTGKLIVKCDAQQVSEKFKKREFVLELSEEINGNIYTNFAKLQLVQNKCDILDRYNVGDVIKAAFNIKGNSYVDKKDGQTKYITNLDCWRMESVGGQQQAASVASQQQEQGFGTPPPIVGGSNTIDDLPF